MKKKLLTIIILVLIFTFYYYENVDALSQFSGFVHDDYFYQTITIPEMLEPELEWSGWQIWYDALPPNGIITGSGSCSNTTPPCFQPYLDFDMRNYWEDSGFYYIVWRFRLDGEWYWTGYHRLYSEEEEEWTEGEATITGTSPASGSIISSEGNFFTFSWEGISAYDLMIVGFNNRLTGISSDYLTFNIDTLIGSSTATNLDAYGIDKNSDWYFQGFLSNLTAEIYEELFFTGQYRSETTNDLAESDNYYLRFSILGYETIFTMETFEDWYAINSTRYDSPTNMFIAISGVLTPIFNRIGEFGQRIEDYFNLDEAYNDAFEIGKNIPIFGYYLEQIAFFIGNFPFIRWVFIILLFLLGIFIFRLVLKFIPFLGGS